MSGAGRSGPQTMRHPEGTLSNWTTMTGRTANVLFTSTLGARPAAIRVWCGQVAVQVPRNRRTAGKGVRPLRLGVATGGGWKHDAVEGLEGCTTVTGDVNHISCSSYRAPNPWSKFDNCFLGRASKPNLSYSCRAISCLDEFPTFHLSSLHACAYPPCAA